MSNGRRGARIALPSQREHVWTAGWAPPRHRRINNVVAATARRQMSHGGKRWGHPSLHCTSLLQLQAGETAHCAATEETLPLGTAAVVMPPWCRRASCCSWCPRMRTAWKPVHVQKQHILRSDEQARRRAHASIVGPETRDEPIQRARAACRGRTRGRTSFGALTAPPSTSMLGAYYSTSLRHHTHTTTIRHPGKHTQRLFHIHTTCHCAGTLVHTAHGAAPGAWLSSS